MIPKEIKSVPLEHFLVPQGSGVNKSRFPHQDWGKTRGVCSASVLVQGSAPEEGRGSQKARRLGGRLTTGRGGQLIAGLGWAAEEYFLPQHA